MSEPRDFGGRTPPPREPDERLADWVDGCMSERERERFTAELRVNPQLRADLAAYERTVATLREALQAPTAPLPRRETAGGGTTIADRVLAQVAGQASGRLLRRAGGGIAWRPVLWSLASAAALLLFTLLLDSWSAEPTTTREAAALDLEASTAKTSEAGTAMPLGKRPLEQGPPEQGIDPAARFRSDQAAAAAPPAPRIQELAEETAKNETAAPGAAGATKPAADRSERDKLEQPAPTPGKPEGGDQPESNRRIQTRRTAEQPAPMVVVPAPSAPVPAPTPSREAAQPSLAKEESKDKRAVDVKAGVPAPVAPDTRGGPPVPGGLAGTTDPTGLADRAKSAKPAPGGSDGARQEPMPTPAGSEREGALVDSPRAASDDFYLGSSRKAAAAPWPLLLIDGVEAAPAPVATGGRGAKPTEAPRSPGAANGGAGPPTSGPAPSGQAPSGPATSGPAGPTGEAAGTPGGSGAPALTQSQLVARIDAFLAAAATVEAAPVLLLATANGTLRLLRLPVAVGPAHRLPTSPQAKATQGTVPREFDWAVEGPEADVAVLLRRVDLFARGPGRSLQNDEIAAPTVPPAVTPPAVVPPEAVPTASAPADAPGGQRQLVLRFRLRPR